MTQSFKRSTADVRAKVIAYFKAHTVRPVIVGDICRELHANINEAILWVEELTCEGTLRQVKKDEMQRYGFSGSSPGYRLK